MCASELSDVTHVVQNYLDELINRTRSNAKVGMPDSGAPQGNHTISQVEETGSQGESVEKPKHGRCRPRKTHTVNSNARTSHKRGRGKQGIGTVACHFIALRPAVLLLRGQPNTAFAIHCLKGVILKLQ